MTKQITRFQKLVMAQDILEEYFNDDEREWWVKLWILKEKAEYGPVADSKPLDWVSTCCKATIGHIWDNILSCSKCFKSVEEPEDDWKQNWQPDKNCIKCEWGWLILNNWEVDWCECNYSISKCDHTEMFTECDNYEYKPATTESLKQILDETWKNTLEELIENISSLRSDKRLEAQIKEVLRIIAKRLW